MGAGKARVSFEVDASRSRLVPHAAGEQSQVSHAQAAPERPLPCLSQSCWNEYLTTRIEQNLVLHCTCPIADCPAQPTGAFIRSIVSSPEVISKVAPPWGARAHRCQEQLMPGCGGAWRCETPRARPSPGGSCVSPVRESPPAWLRGELLQPDVVHQPPGLRPHPVPPGPGLWNHLLQVWLGLLLQLQLP